MFPIYLDDLYESATDVHRIHVSSLSRTNSLFPWSPPNAKRNHQNKSSWNSKYLCEKHFGIDEILDFVCPDEISKIVPETLPFCFTTEFLAEWIQWLLWGLHRKVESLSATDLLQDSPHQDQWLSVSSHFLPSPAPWLRVLAGWPSGRSVDGHFLGENK